MFLIWSELSSEAQYVKYVFALYQFSSDASSWPEQQQRPTAAAAFPRALRSKARYSNLPDASQSIFFFPRRLSPSLCAGHVLRMHALIAKESRRRSQPNLLYSEREGRPLESMAGGGLKRKLRRAEEC
jgi:hypothetical protein